MTTKRAWWRLLVGELSEEVVILPHHHKPYRVRHMGFLFLALVLLMVFILELGILAGRNSRAANLPEAKVAAAKSTMATVRSGYGFSLGLDSNIFTISALGVNDAGQTATVSHSDLRAGKPLTQVTITPELGKVATTILGTQLSLRVLSDSNALTTQAQRADNASLTTPQVAAKLFAEVSDKNFTVVPIGTSTDVLNGVSVQKTIYQSNPKFQGGATYTVVWAGSINGRAFALKLSGLVGSAQIPAEYTSIFDTLNLSSNQKVEADSSSKPTPSSSLLNGLDSKYLSDLVSPAVVKVYRIVCGAVTVDGQVVVNSGCDVVTGSGFLASSDGYIATNGHVVVNGPKDILVNQIIKDPNTTTDYLKGLGLTVSQISSVTQSPSVLASLISKVYDIADDRIAISGKADATFVALGNKPLNLSSFKSAHDITSMQDTDFIKNASIVDYNYSGKDLYTIVADPTEGFSSSDVALLKIKIQNAPFIRLNTTKILQNQHLIVMGFPGDADNTLTDNDQLAVSVTNGNVSSIRQAAGGSGTLYQSDADASHGSSGGPAIADDGTVFGLLTYRYASTEQGNAAKSYIRNITDFKNLVSDNNIILNQTSASQVAWEKGLKLYSQNHFLGAEKQFAAVKYFYPAQRNIDDYVTSTQQAIAAGKNVAQLPTWLPMSGAVLSTAMVGGGLVVIARHRNRHQIYKHNMWAPAHA